MGLILSVYRAVDFPDCTLNGLSAQFAELTVVNVDGPFEPCAKRPACWLVKGHIPNSAHLVVVDPASGDGRWFMMGGNYAGTSDSRFNEAVQKLTGSRPGVLPVHDRHEG